MVAADLKYCVLFPSIHSIYARDDAVDHQENIMAADQSSKLLENITALSSPHLYPIKLKEKSFPVVNCSFTDTKFEMKFFGGDPTVVS